MMPAQDAMDELESMAARETVADWLDYDADVVEFDTTYEQLRRLGKRRPQYQAYIVYSPGQPDPVGVARVRKEKR
jgi:predicted alpha/beta-hydrolase family hydrolase